MPASLLDHEFSEVNLLDTPKVFELLQHGVHLELDFLSKIGAEIGLGKLLFRDQAQVI